MTVVREDSFDASSAESLLPFSSTILGRKALEENCGISGWSGIGIRWLLMHIGGKEVNGGMHEQ